MNPEAGHLNPPSKAEPLTLAVSSSTGIMSVGVSAGDRVASVDLATERQHAEELTPLIGELVSSFGASIGDLQRLVVDIGPGRFTGLRVGLTTVRALSFGLAIPVVPLTSLEILAHRAAAGSGPVTAVIDARRQEVFQQCFLDGKPDGEAVVGPPEELASKARGVVAGDGLDRYLALYQQVGGDQVGDSRVELRVDVHPSAAAALELAVGRSGVAGAEVAPLYLRDPDAVANIRTRSKEAAT